MALLAIGLLVVALVMAAGCTSSSYSSVKNNEISGIWAADENTIYSYLFIFPDGHAISSWNYKTHPDAYYQDKISDAKWEKSSNDKYIIKGGVVGTYNLSDSSLQCNQFPYTTYLKYADGNDLKKGIAELSMTEKEFVSHFMDLVYEDMVNLTHPDWMYILDYLNTHNIDSKNTIPDDIENEIKGIAGSYPILNFLGHERDVSKYTILDVHGEYNSKDNYLTLYYAIDANMDNTIWNYKDTLYGKYDKNSKTFTIEKYDSKFIAPPGAISKKGSNEHEIYYYYTQPMKVEYVSDINVKVKKSSGSMYKYDYYETYDENGNYLKTYYK